MNFILFEGSYCRLTAWLSSDNGGAEDNELFSNLVSFPNISLHYKDYEKLERLTTESIFLVVVKRSRFLKQ